MWGFFFVFLFFFLKRPLPVYVFNTFTPVLRPPVSVTPDQPQCHHLQPCPATPPRTTARLKTTKMTSATTRTWRPKRTRWTSASPTRCLWKTSPSPSSGPTGMATRWRARKTETDALLLNLTSETLICGSSCPCRRLWLRERVWRI